MPWLGRAVVVAPVFSPTPSFSQSLLPPFGRLTRTSADLILFSTTPVVLIRPIYLLFSLRFRFLLHSYLTNWKILSIRQWCRKCWRTPCCTVPRCGLLSSLHRKLVSYFHYNRLINSDVELSVVLYQSFQCFPWEGYVRRAVPKFARSLNCSCPCRMILWVWMPQVFVLCGSHRFNWIDDLCVYILKDTNLRKIGHGSNCPVVGRRHVQHSLLWQCVHLTHLVIKCCVSMATDTQSV